MRRALRVVGTMLIVAGVSAAAWTFTVWLWKDPFTTLYTTYQQHRLSAAYERRFEAWQPPRTQRFVSRAGVRAQLAAEARSYRRASKRGEAIGRIVVPHLGLDMVLVNGTNESSLEKGPGRDLQTYMPGQGQLVYIAGHRTTYAAPFANIDTLRPGDSVTLEMPYATFRYAITGHRVVRATDVAVLRSHGREQLILQACHPRFFASHRYLAYARPVWVRPRDEPKKYRLWASTGGSRPVSRQALSGTAGA